MRTEEPWTTEKKHNQIDLFGRENGGCALIATIESCCEEDAALIVAAPLMLNALVEVIGILEAYSEDHASDSPTDPTVCLPRLHSVVRAAEGMQERCRYCGKL